MKNLIIISLVLLTISSFSQDVMKVIDAKMAGSILANHLATMTALSPIENNLSEVRYHQQQVAKKITIVTEVKNKLYKSKFKVPTEIINGANVKSIGKLITDIGKYQKEMVEYAKVNPALLIVAYQSELALLNRSISLLSYLNDFALVGGEKNLINAKDRMQIIRRIIKELRLMRALAYGISRRMKVAAKASILQQITPFDLEYPDNDKEIVQRILNDLKK